MANGKRRSWGCGYYLVIAEGSVKVWETDLGEAGLSGPLTPCLAHTDHSMLCLVIQILRPSGRNAWRTLVPTSDLLVTSVAAHVAAPLLFEQTCDMSSSPPKAVLTSLTSVVLL